MKNTEATDTITLHWVIPYTPNNEFEDMQQRDRAAEWARQSCRRAGRNGVNVISINRGRKNLVVRVAVDPR